MAELSPPAPLSALRPAASRRLDRLRVRHLRLLELVAGAGSLTAAAQALHISQPSATKMLQELEHAFGCTLVDRNARGGSLSPAGARALERLRIATGALDAASRAIADAPARPLVRIGMLPLAGVALVPRLVALLAQRGALPRLQLRESSVREVLGLLLEGRIDCVIGRVDDVQPQDAERFEIVRLTDERFEIACAPDHRLARARRVPLARLRDEAWAVAPQGTYTRQAFDAAFVSMGLLPPAPALESPSFHTSLATVATSGLLAFAPRSAVQAYVGAGRVRRVALAQPFPADYAVFVTLRGLPMLPAVEQVRACLQEITGCKV